MELTGEKFRPDEPITIEEMRLLLSQIFNGKKLEKNVPEGTAAGSTIMLCDLETTLEYR